MPQGGNIPRQHQSRSRVPQSPLREGVQHVPNETHTPCLPPVGPMVPTMPVHHGHHPASIARARAATNYPAYTSSIQSSLAGQWASQSSMGRLAVNGSPGHHSSGFVDRYMQMEALQAQQPDAMSQGNLGTLMGNHYQNSGIVQHYQNGHGHGHPQVPTSANARGWVINQPYDHMYR